MMNYLILSLIPLFLCWGSFLNVAGYRLLHSLSLVRPRSHCVHCKQQIAWHDLIPVISWVALQGKCRYCKVAISWLYPCIELITAIMLSLLVLYIPTQYLFGYGIFFSALIVSIRTDIDQMLISRYVTLFLIPIAFMLSAFDLLQITFIQSIVGAGIGYGVLTTIRMLFYVCTKKEGLGDGDAELLSLIGAFTGIYGCWVSLLLGSIIGSFVGIFYLSFFSNPSTHTRIPFGPFLACGAIMFVFAQTWLLEKILGIVTH